MGVDSVGTVCSAAHQRFRFLPAGACGRCGHGIDRHVLVREREGSTGHRGRRFIHPVDVPLLVFCVGSQLDPLEQYFRGMARVSVRRDFRIVSI